ncbi:hypothetical protein [Blastopirellula marina]|uniref:Uncharacterized protein n=1 Tax=Blastopirellula marina DSM 3645 TaxID=314230 RepID=A4A245_9BACT|nr:hypothetical protein [Blastopirellula marina]EAQ77148.1 hypothetical protein DSM3645_15130 [Blastopirellula marina DSM 3645]
MNFLAQLAAIAVVLSAPMIGLAVEPRVAGLHDLVVVEPGMHRDGLPAVSIRDSGESFTAEIPPTLHIHRYFYSGDREFQGPIIQGGPTVIIASHPKTGQRVYTEVTLAAGSPVIAHNKHGIEYIYDHSRIEINYGCDEQSVRVKYHSGQGVRRNLANFREHVFENAGQHLGQSQTLGALKETMHGGGQLAKSAVGAVDSCTAKLLNGAKSLSSAIPGVTPLSSYADDQPARQYEKQIDRAQRLKDSASLDFVPTNR